VFLASAVALLQAQDLAPRAYVITPLHTNAITLTYVFYNGSLLFNGAVPVTGATGNYSVPIFTLYHSFGLAGHSANISGSLPYAIGTFEGEAIGEDQQIHRSGLLDTTFRLAVNLRGGPSMEVSEFSEWEQKALLGVSLKVVAPSGQYDPNRLVNWGSNRWSFKPELGYSRRRKHMVLDGYAGVWLFTANEHSFSPTGPQPQTEKPVYSFEGHLSYDLKPRLWFSLDGNFWIGGLAELNGTENPSTRQTSSRIGATTSLPLAKHQSVKVSYANDLYVRFGGDYRNISVAWQYSWFGRPQ
jgi:Putative MetA-pathway of phenol degradation